MKTLHSCLALLPILLTALLPAAVQAQEELLRCADVADDTTRLACYDRLARELRSAAGVEIADDATANSTSPGPNADNAASSPVEPVGNGMRSALALFGFESRPEEQRAITEVADRLEGAVTSASHSPFSGWTLTLDNGQVWKQIGSDRFDIEAGDQAVITRGSLNSFLLQRGGEGRRIRVSRVK